MLLPEYEDEKKMTCSYGLYCMMFIEHEDGLFLEVVLYVS